MVVASRTRSSHSYVERVSPDEEKFDQPIESMTPNQLKEMKYKMQQL